MHLTSTSEDFVSNCVICALMYFKEFITDTDNGRHFCKNSIDGLICDSRPRLKSCCTGVL